jgi:hypothetical protein
MALPDTPFAGAPVAGKNARVTVGGGDEDDAPPLATLNASEWNVDLKGDDLDVTTFEDGGYETGTIGILSADVSVKAPWDANLNPFDDPPAIYATDDLDNLTLYIIAPDPDVPDDEGVFWNFPFSRVLSSKVGAPVKDKVSFEWSGKNNGAFATP